METDQELIEFAKRGRTVQTVAKRLPHPPNPGRSAPKKEAASLRRPLNSLVPRSPYPHRRARAAHRRLKRGALPAISQSCRTYCGSRDSEERELPSPRFPIWPTGSPWLKWLVAPVAPDHPFRHTRWEIDVQSSWTMERLDCIIRSGGAHVLGGASGDIATDHAYSQRRRKGRSRNPANDHRKSRGAC